jgi:hypothetical protein
MQVVVAIVLPCAFGALTGLMLGVHEVAYLVLAVPIGLAGGYFAGLEHPSGREGAVRGAVGGLQFGALIVGVHELTGIDPKADIPDPAILLVVVTTVVGAVLGFLGGLTRRARMVR